MKKKLLLFMAMAFTFFAVPLTAHAETYTGGEGWNVDFDGNNLNSTFKSSDVNDSIQKLQPGDTVNISLDLHNSYDALTDWYMTNEVLQSLEDSQSVANGGAYSYILTYVDPDGTEELIYSSETIGGENAGISEKGLHQATGNMEDFFYLGGLDMGETAQIRLTVALEGETQGNDYQDTLAKLQMNFAVEVLEDIPGITVDENGNRIRKRTVAGDGISQFITLGKVRSVKTGDDMVSVPFSIVTLLLGIGFVVLAFYKKKKEAE